MSNVVHSDVWETRERLGAKYPWLEGAAKRTQTGKIFRAIEAAQLHKLNPLRVS